MGLFSMPKPKPRMEVSYNDFMRMVQSPNLGDWKPRQKAEEAPVNFKPPKAI